MTLQQDLATLLHAQVFNFLQSLPQLLHIIPYHCHPIQYQHRQSRDELFPVLPSSNQEPLFLGHLYSKVAKEQGGGREPPTTDSAQE